MVMLFIYVLYRFLFRQQMQKPGSQVPISIHQKSNDLHRVASWQATEAQGWSPVMCSEIQRMCLSLVTTWRLGAWVNNEEPVWERQLMSYFEAEENETREEVLRPKPSWRLQLRNLQQLRSLSVSLSKYIWRNMHLRVDRACDMGTQTVRRFLRFHHKQTGCGKAARIYNGNLVKGDPSETCFLNTCIPKLHETWASDRPRKITTELKLVYLSDNDTFLRVSWDHAFRCLSATKDTFPSLHSSLESMAGFCRPSEHASDNAMTRNRSFHAPCLVVWNIYFSIYWESYSQLTFIFSYFSERFKPPTSS